MRRHLLLIAVLFLASCSWWQPQTEHPTIEAGIQMAQAQMALQAEYLELYEFVGPEQREWLNDNVAPLIDEAKYMIGLYNDAILADKPPGVTEAEIRLLLRRIAAKMLEVPDAY